MSTVTEARLEPTGRTRINRGRNRAVADRAELLDLLADALVAHVGVQAPGTDGRPGHPVVLPTAYAVDVDGPDWGGTLYVHGSVAARWLRASVDRTVCVTVTELDGLVAGRSAFHHSMNYRSAVVIGRARLVDDPDERQHALDLIVDHMLPGRAATLRPSTRKELAATAVLAVPLHEASMKARAGGPVDEPEDVEAGVWGGHVPVRRVIDAPVPAEDNLPGLAVPDDVSGAGRTR
ncbi:flavin-nucleotide-binding protein [Nocardioides aromaticivorans]|uniref:Flavin-nucleotide-binding protein n=1 Tax=Nocardioides aromaticivorans TaxID=200618 RepID=A0ABX7PFR2_9ACTN|nr:pyridoxamine 5'-phosphate oxidase family protein [Nocardioides aromaticivorans]QSR24756.1 flavin-nucleotide-binding protein [Nocardioides aromaticivorans]